MEQPYYPYQCDFGRSCFAYKIWLPDSDGNPLQKQCVEVFVPDDFPIYEGPLNCGTWYMEALPIPQYPGLWTGDKPVWVDGSLYNALEYCQIPDTGAYSTSYGFSWDALRIP